MLIADPGLGDQAILTATSEASTMEASNLQSMQPTDAWRATDMVDLRLRVQLLPLPGDEGVEWRLVAPLYTNFVPGGGTWQLKASTSEARLDALDYDYEPDPLSGWSSPGLYGWRARHGWVHAAPLWLGPEAAPRTEEWLDIFISNVPGPSDPVVDFVQWGRLVISDPWTPSYHHEVNAEVYGGREVVEKRRAPGGALRVRRSPRPRELHLTVGNLSREEAMLEAFELDSNRGASGDVLVMLEPEDATYRHALTVLGLLEPGPITHRDYEDYARRYTVEELL